MYWLNYLGKQTLHKIAFGGGDAMLDFKWIVSFYFSPFLQVFKIEFMLYKYNLLYKKTLRISTCIHSMNQSISCVSFTPMLPWYFSVPFQQLSITKKSIHNFSSGLSTSDTNHCYRSLYMFSELI